MVFNLWNQIFNEPRKESKNSKIVTMLGWLQNLIQISILHLKLQKSSRQNQIVELDKEKLVMFHNENYIHDNLWEKLMFQIQLLYQKEWNLDKQQNNPNQLDNPKLPKQNSPKCWWTKRQNQSRWKLSKVDKQNRWLKVQKFLSNQRKNLCENQQKRN